MTGAGLNNKLNYLGMVRGIRKLALSEQLASAEQLAVLSICEVCDLVVKEFEVVFAEKENIGLVKKSDMNTYNKIIKRISR